MTNSKVLIVDDEPFNVDYLEQELEDLDCETISAVNGQDALTQVTREMPDLILLDIMMPVMDGFEVLSRLKADPATRDIPVIVISAHTDLASMVKGIQLGAEDYLPKPFEPTLLQARVCSSLEKKHLRDLQHLYLKSLEREMEIGREIQKGFLPSGMPRVDGWEITAYFKAAREVAGDFYDAFYLSSEQQVCLVIADVCDKGVGAALFMTLFRSLLRFTLQAADVLGERSPAARLKNAAALTNNYIANTHGDTGMFATVFCGLLDPVDGVLAYVNAGHENPLLLHPNGECARLRSTGPALGAIAGAGFSVEEVRMEAGDLLFAFTDGAPDALSPVGDRFGRERLLAHVGPGTSAEELLAGINARLSVFVGEAEQFDDITMLAIRRVPGREPS